MSIRMSTNFRRALLTTVIAGVMASLPFGRTLAADFPNKPIVLVSAFGPGGTTDILARAIAPPLSEALGVPVVVEDRVGGSGTIAVQHVAKSAPDGYTLLVTTASPIVVVPHTSNIARYEPTKDFAPITLMGITPEVLAVNTDVPATNLKELIALSAKRQVTIGSSGTGGLPHMTIELLRTASEGRIVHVPFKSAGFAVTDTLGGHVDGTFVDLPALFGQIQSGRLRGITIANTKRSEFLPQLPTSGEQGYPSILGINWTGIMAPAGTPQGTLETLHHALSEVVKLDTIKQAMVAAAIEVSISDSPADFAKFIASEDAKWSKVVKDAGIQPNH